ncbi:hypothetical protein ACFSM5_18375 [Lacibacterium aquatile]|uniref:N-acetyltransferase domain-containing protein n=1 Tax=Lacibacterium aquatile TaxID=1168082 RepID=A0ABW5DWP3_9PROT
MTNYDIRSVRTSQDFRAFIDAASVSQGGDRNWRAPLDYEMRQLFSPANNPFIRQNAVQPFVAFDGNRAVGRVVAIHDLAHQAKYGTRTVFFGFIEGIDDPALFAALLERVAAWGRERGLTRIEGPFSFSINNEVGLLVEGFDTPPQTKTNHAQPWYGRHIEAAGFSRVKDILAHRHPLASDQLGPRYSKLAERWSESARLSLHSMESWGYETGMKIVNAIYNDAWADNWHATPVGVEEARFIGALMKPLVVGPVVGGNWVRVACWDGEPIAVVAQIPDVHDAVAGLKGKLFPFGWLRMLRRLKAGGQGGRLPMIGVRRAFRGTRIGAMAISALLVDAQERARARGTVFLEISWMLEDNHDILRLVEGMPAQIYKRWRVYGR